MPDQRENPIEALIRKFNRAGDFEVRYVKGHVVACDVMVRNHRKIYAVHIENGSQRESFWLAHDESDKQFHQPLVGEWVSGTVNTFDDCQNFADLTLKPIFDFKNRTRTSEDDAFDWFKRQAAKKDGLSPS